MPYRYIEFSKWLKAELDKRNWTRADLARVSGLTTATLSLIANGQRGLGIKSAQQIAKAFDMREVDVLRVSGLATPDLDDYPLPIRNTLTMMIELDDEDQADVEALVRALRERRDKYHAKGAERANA